MGKIILKSVDLHRILSDALPFASPAGIPQIEAVRIETTPNDADTVNVVAVATDRFVLGVSRVAVAGDAGIGVTLSTDDVKNVVRIAKTVRRDAGWREVVVTTDSIGESVTFEFGTGETVKVRPIDAEFPKWRQLLNVDVDAIARPTAGIGISPAKLATFARVAASKSDPLQLYAGVDAEGRLKPIHVRIGDDFYGLVMPVRAPEGQLFTYARPEWMV